VLGVLLPYRWCTCRGPHAGPGPLHFRPGAPPPFNDRLLNGNYRKDLAKICIKGKTFNPDIPLDMDTPSPTTFDNSVRGPSDSGLLTVCGVMYGSLMWTRPAPPRSTTR